MSKKKIIALHEHPELLEEVKKLDFELEGISEALEALKKEDEAIRRKAERLQKDARKKQKAMIGLLREKLGLGKQDHFKVDLDYLEQFGLAFLLMQEDCGCPPGTHDEDATGLPEGVVIAGNLPSGLSRLMERLMGGKDDDDDNNDKGSGGSKLN